MSDHSPRDRNGGDSRGNSYPRRQGSTERGRSRDRDRDERRNKDPENYTQIYVAKLPRRTREDDLKSEFSKFGRIKNMTLKHSYAFIDYEDHEVAVKSLEHFNGKNFNGEELVVE